MTNTTQLTAPTETLILATGDLAPDRDDIGSSFGKTRELLRSADLTFGQLESVLADTGTRMPQARHAVLAAPKAAKAYADAGYNVISTAGNHCMDWGANALLETIDHLNDANLNPVGAGKNLSAARAPVFYTTPAGHKIALLARSSILPQDYWANERRAGCAPLRAHTVYEQIEHDQPGTPPRILSFAHQGDLADLCDDIKAARAKADIVLVSLHWGLHFVRAELADYQRQVAKAVIAAGADAILGHHAHILKGVEMIDGKPVFYSLCNFAVDLKMDPEHATRPSFLEIKSLAEEWEVDFDSLYNFPTASRLSMIARLQIDENGNLNAGFHPVFIGKDAVPIVLSPDDPRFTEVLDYVRAISTEAGLSPTLSIHNDYVALESET